MLTNSNPTNGHILIMIHAKLTSTMRIHDINLCHSAKMLKRALSLLVCSSTRIHSSPLVTLPLTGQ